MVFNISTYSFTVILALQIIASNQKSLTLEDILPEDSASYDKMIPPKKDHKPIPVHFHVTVMGIDSINENSMTYTADIFCAQTWTDYRLRLPDNMTQEYRLLNIDWLSKLWRPDSYFKNAKQVTFQTMTIPNHYVWLYESKLILYMVKLTLKLSCAMTFDLYPHDTQECKLQMESLSHTTEEMVFEWDTEVPLVVDDTVDLPQQNIISTFTSDCTQVYSTGNFTCLEVVFRLKRRLGHYVFHTYTPTCLIVIMSWVSFWIKPEIAPARVTLGVTSLLTLFTQQAKSQASLPPVSYIKTIDIFMSSCMLFVFMALMEYAVVNVVLGDGSNDKPPPKPEAKPKPAQDFDLPPPPPPPCQYFDGPKEAFYNRGGFMTKEARRFLNKTFPKKEPPPPTAAQRRARALMIDKISRYLFPLSFFMLNAIYWITFWEDLF